MRRPWRSCGARLHAAALLAALLPAAHAADTAKAVPHGPFHALKFRDLGPAVAGGRVASVLGVPGDAALYYVGTAGACSVQALRIATVGVMRAAPGSASRAGPGPTAAARLAAGSRWAIAAPRSAPSATRSHELRA